VTKLVAKDGAVEGVVAGSVREEAIRAEKVILATDGFAGNREMVRAYCEADIADALYYGSDGNTGDGIRWGARSSAARSRRWTPSKATRPSSAGPARLSTYAVVMNGGILVNADGERFGNESKGYSEFAVDVVRQPDGVAYEIFDERIFERLQGEFDDFDRAVELGSYTSADTVEELAAELGCAPEATRDAVESYNAAVDAGEPDEVGRADGRNVLSPPFYGTEVTGSLFHTQGGLVVDEHARVLREDGSTVDGLYAGVAPRRASAVTGPTATSPGTGSRPPWGSAGSPVCTPPGRWVSDDGADRRRDEAGTGVCRRDGTDHRNRPGIGRACAVRFAERGATVVGGDRLDQSETAGTCTDLPGRSSRWLPT